MPDDERNFFEGIKNRKGGLWSELGSRSFFRELGKKPDKFSFVEGWVEVQSGRYRYSIIENGGVFVHMVLSEYLACWVYWNG